MAHASLYEISRNSKLIIVKIKCPFLCKISFSTNSCCVKFVRNELENFHGNPVTIDNTKYN
jgi:hypothetical protein